MGGGHVAVVLAEAELLFLEFGIGQHAGLAVIEGQVEHTQIEGMEAGQGHELKLVAHGAQLALKGGDGGVVQVGLPVERGRTVVGQQLAGKFGVDAFGEAPGLVQVGFGGFAPDHVGEGGIGQPAGDGGLDAILNIEEAFAGAGTVEDEGPVPLVDVAGDQLGSVRIRAGHQNGGNAADIGRQARRYQLGHRFLGGHQHFAAHVPAFFGRRELILEMNPGRAGFDHLFHQFKGVQRTAEPGFGVGHDGGEPVRPGFAAVEHLDLVGPPQGVVDSPHHRRHAVGGVQALVRVHLTGQVGVGGHLPAAQVDGLETGLDLLHGLIAGQCAQGGHVFFVVDQVPEAFGPDFGEGVLDGQVAAQLEDIIGRVGANDTFPARIFGPVGLQRLALVGDDFVAGQAFADLCGFLFDGLHSSSSPKGLSCRSPRGLSSPTTGRGWRYRWS